MVVPREEKEVIRGIVRAVRVLKQSRIPEVSRAAAKWDRSLSCFIKFRLMNSVATPRRVVVRVTSSPSTSRNPRGASPSQG
jgi:hypothetical protein